MNIGRNDPCPCGSGKKFKKCHGRADAEPLAGLERRQFSVVEPAAPEPPTSFAAEGADDDMDPRNNDVMSTDYWDKAAKRLPRHLRKELGPQVKHVRKLVEIESLRVRIDAAIEALEPTRAEYERLVEDTEGYLRRAEALFAEDRFAGMRFRAADIRRAERAAGSTPLDATPDQQVAFVEKMLDFLLKGGRRRDVGLRLLGMMPDFVAEGRHLDAWIIWHSAEDILEPVRGEVSPFLAAMLMYGHDDHVRQEEEGHDTLLQGLGLSVEQIQAMGYDGIAQWIERASKDPAQVARMEALLQDNPALSRRLKADCRAAEDASIEFLTREDAHALLLSAEEVRPWMETLEERLSRMPETARLPEGPNPKPLSRKAQKAMTELARECAVDMAHKLLTPERLARLTMQLQELAAAYEAKGDRAGVRHAQGALMQCRMDAGPGSEPTTFLYYLCWQSLRRAVLGLTDGPDPAGPSPHPAIASS
jgi:hypothetical protein